MAQDLTYVYQHWFSYSAVRYFAFPSKYLVYLIVIVYCGIQIRSTKPELKKITVPRKSVQVNISGVL